MQIPRSIDPVLSRGDSGAGVWALQRGLNEEAENRRVAEDGAFGYATEGAVKRFQADCHIDPDGAVAEVTTHHLIERLQVKVYLELPTRILEGFAMYEGGMNLGAVNWGAPGGVDCGIVQRRVFEPDYGNDAVVRRAFDPLYQLRLTGKSLVEWAGKYWEAPNQVKTREQAWRLACLRHNYPSGADHLAVTPLSQLSSYWTTAQSWVPRVTFDDGYRVVTPLNWCRFYALGSPEHNEPGLVTALTRNWP